MRNKKKQYKKEDIIIYLSSIKERDISTYNKRSLVMSVCGVGCIVLGVVTSFIPFTSIPLYIVGGGLLGYDVVALYYSIKRVVVYEFNLKVLTASARAKEWVKGCLK